MILWIKSYDVTIQMKAVEHYVPLLLFIMLYNCRSNLWVCGWILQCDHSVKATGQCFHVDF